MLPGDVLSIIRTGVRYELEEHLGSGAFGEVWRCAGLDHPAKPQRAVKIVKTEDTSSVVEEVRKHKKAVDRAGCVHVPELFETDDALVLGSPSPPVYLIAMQLIEGLAADKLPSLESLRAREMVANVVMHDVLVALSRLHRASILHRDVKPANILVEFTGNCYLCDFGVSLFLDEVPPGQPLDQAGTPLYMAPEMLKTVPPSYDEKADVWALGVVGYELDLGRTPIQERRGDMPNQGLIFNKLQTMTSPVFESCLSIRYRNLVQPCLEVDPARRPTSAELLRHQAPSVRAADRRHVASLVA